MTNLCKVKDCNKPVRAYGYCIKHDKQIKRHGKILKNGGKDFNETIDKGKWYELILTDKDMKEIGRAKIDKDDLEKVKLLGRWSLNKQGYVCNSSNKVYMHRLIMNAKDTEDVDHRKTGVINRSNNRKKNLRIATRSENMFNTEPHKDNSSGYKGVTWNSVRKRWHARIMVKGNKIDLGCFKDIKDAHQAYIEAAKSAHKKFFNAQTTVKDKTK